MRSTKLLVRLGVILAVAAAGAWAIYANVGARAGGMDMNARVTGAGAPFPVTVDAAEQGALEGAVTYTGSVVPFNEEDIYPRVTGRIVEMRVYPGDAVTAGQIVARLDDVELGSRVVEAEASRAAALANRTQMEAELVAAQHVTVQADKELAMVEAESSYARGVASRSERLVQSGAISQQEFENDRSLAASLHAKREAARAKVDQAHALQESARRKLEAAGSMVAQADAQLRTARVVRDYVEIVAPSAGYVVKRLVAPGVLVQPGMSILKIAQMDRVRLQANVGERDLAAIRVGAPVRVTATTASIEARVTSVFPFVDAGGRTAVVEATVDNATRRLVPGQYVNMRFITGVRTDAISVPRGAVTRLGAAATVWQVAGDRVEPREVVTGLENADRVEILRGLPARGRVVVRGQDGLYAGARVQEIRADEARREAPPPRPTPRVEEGEKGGPHAGH